jgi:DHA1 family bicyclomycin/chloramphenicol resistance-like MFS transporter
MEGVKPVKQKYLGKWGVVGLVSILGMTVPASMDMYLPAVPTMTGVFSAQVSEVNLTLVLFFMFLAVGIIFSGPLSDRYGRRPVLITSLLTYIAFSLLCAAAPSLWVLILARIFQALGAGGMMSVSTALVKDCFDGKVREVVLSIVQGMTVIAPMASPVAGAAILSVASWRETFLVLAIIGGVCLVGALLMTETLPQDERLREGMAGSLARIVTVAKNKSFAWYLIVVSLLMAPFMAYISVSSYVYIDLFGLNEKTYSFYFAINATTALLGPPIFLLLRRFMSQKGVTHFCLAIGAVSGALVLFAGKTSPLVFMLSFIPFNVIGSAIRPGSTSVLLEQQKNDTGSASSLLNAAQTVFGSVGMVFGTLQWGDFITGLGICILTFTFLSIAAWAALLRSGVKVKGLK